MKTIYIIVTDTHQIHGGYFEDLKKASSMADKLQQRYENKKQFTVVPLGKE